MPRPSEEEIDCIAAEVADDLRKLAGIWTGEGAAALDAAVRTDVGLTFAIVDARAATGVIRLIALRRARRAMLLTFAQAGDGTRGIVASGLEPYHRVSLLADTELSNVSISDSADTFPPGDEDSARLAAALAWRFDIGVSHVAHSLAALPSLPAEFQLGRPWETFQTFMPALMAALDSAADLLTGNTSYFEGLPAVSGLPIRDRDITPVYGVDSMRDDLDKAFEFNRGQKRGTWTWSDEVASFEAYARSNAEPHLRSLLERFRGDAFARL